MAPSSAAHTLPPLCAHPSAQQPARWRSSWGPADLGTALALHIAILELALEVLPRFLSHRGHTVGRWGTAFRRSGPPSICAATRPVNNELAFPRARTTGPGTRRARSQSRLQRGESGTGCCRRPCAAASRGFAASPRACVAARKYGQTSRPRPPGHTCAPTQGRTHDTGTGEGHRPSRQPGRAPGYAARRSSLPCARTRALHTPPSHARPRPRSCCWHTGRAP